MRKEYSAEEACAKAEAYCTLAERCKSEVRLKLQQLGTAADVVEGILTHLEDECFIDELRYAKAFVRDKYRFSQWGRVKISHALKMKCIMASYIEEGLKQIDDEEYQSILSGLLSKKKRTVKYANHYELNGKLIRFAIGHGYEMNEILLCLKQIGCSDEYLD